MVTTAYPAGAPSVNGTNITVDTMLKQPKYITKAAVPSNEIFLSEFLFRQDGTGDSGAIIFQRAKRAGAYPTFGDVQEIAPMANFPLIDGDDDEWMTDLARKFGTAFRFSDEARDRNARDAFTRNTLLARNALVRQDAARCYQAFIDAGVPQRNAIAPWNSASQKIRRDIRTAQSDIKNEKLGYAADTVILNPNAALEIELNEDLQKLLPTQIPAYNPWLSPGLKNLLNINWVENEHLPEDTVIVLQRNVSGVNAVEKDTSTETLREAGEKTLVQIGRRSLPVITDPYSAIILKGVIA